MSDPLLVLDRVGKVYRRSRLSRETAFRLDIDRSFAGRQIVGVLGPNGAGKTTLFEMIAGSNQPTAGQVRIAGQDIHRVRPRERDRLAIHYHQSYQVRRFRHLRPAWLMERAASPYPLVHLFDEPQFNTQDGYIGFMLDFFRRLKGEERLVFVCLHPTAPFQIDILREICDRFLFVGGGAVRGFEDLPAAVAEPAVRRYLGALADHAGAEPTA